MSVHAGHPDIFDQRDPLRGPFVVALSLHAAVLLGALLYTWLSSHTDSFGARDAGGVSIGVETVDAIPLIHHGATNPLTNDTPSEVPQEAVTKLKDQVKEDVTPPDAIKLRTKKQKKPLQKEASERQKYRPYEEIAANQLTSKSAPQVSSPIFAPAPGSGQIGAGKNNLLGDQFPEYARQIQDTLTRNWHTGELDSKLHSAPVVDITFDLMRDGSVRNIQLAQKSGNLLVDNSVQRAVLDSKFPPLPPQFKRDSASIEFTFELKR